MLCRSLAKTCLDCYTRAGELLQQWVPRCASSHGQYLTSGSPHAPATFGFLLTFHFAVHHPTPFTFAASPPRHAKTPKRQICHGSWHFSVCYIPTAPRQRQRQGGKGTPKSHANDTGIAEDSTPTAKFGRGKNQPRQCQTRQYWRIIYRIREHEVVVFAIAIDWSSERLSAQCLRDDGVGPRY
jgi:hypothetical protein